MARFDLTRVRLRHYRSIAGCDVALGPLTVRTAGELLRVDQLTPENHESQSQLELFG